MRELLFDRNHNSRTKPANYFCKAIFLINFISVGSFAALDVGTWAKTIRPTAINNLLRNISVPGNLPGSIIASPSKSDPDYFYHWVRDAGLVTQTLVREYQKSTLQSEKERYLQIINDSIQFNLQIQENSKFGKGLGEPRFNLDGTVSLVPWPRPQDDGPALRVIGMIQLAGVWISQGHEDWVRSKLYKNSGQSLIKADLEFLSHHWKRTSFDLWEELHGHHFFTRLAQRRALHDGSKLAIHLGDYEAGGWYLKQAGLLETELLRHWDAKKGYIVSTIDRDGGIDYKEQNLDTSVILSVLASSKDDGFFSIADERVLATVLHITKAFKELYPINQNGIEGIAIGRYPEDRYDGISPSGTGNPWVLTTAALAEYYYRLARHFEEKGTNLDILGSLRATGDNYLSRIQTHGHSNGSLSEQINRSSGLMQGAQDLTWSYSSLINAIDARR